MRSRGWIIALVLTAASPTVPASSEDAVVLGGTNVMSGATSGTVRVIVPVDAAYPIYSVQVEGPNEGRAAGFVLTDGVAGVVGYRVGFCETEGCESDPPPSWLWRHVYGDAAFGVTAVSVPGKLPHRLIPAGEYDLTFIADGGAVTVTFPLADASTFEPLAGGATIDSFAPAGVQIQTRIKRSSDIPVAPPVHHDATKLHLLPPLLIGSRTIDGGSDGTVWITTALGHNGGPGVDTSPDWHCQYQGEVPEAFFGPGCPGYEPTERAVSTDRPYCDARRSPMPNFSVVGVGTGGASMSEDTCAGLVPPDTTMSVGAWIGGTNVFMLGVVVIAVTL